MWGAPGGSVLREPTLEAAAAAARAPRTRSAALSARRQPRRHGPQPALRASPTPLITATAPDPRAGPRAAGMSCVEVSVPSAAPGEAPSSLSDPFPGAFVFYPESLGGRCWKRAAPRGPDCSSLLAPPQELGWDRRAPKPNFSSLRSLGGVCRREESAFPSGTALPPGKALLQAPAVPAKGVRPQSHRLGPGTLGRGHSCPQAAAGTRSRVPKSHARAHTHTSDRRGLSRPRETSEVGWRGVGE